MALKETCDDWQRLDHLYFRDLRKAIKNDNILEYREYFIKRYYKEETKDKK